jgi:ADP-ribose pyrophosphatase YjhB (NUDIX family)
MTEPHNPILRAAREHVATKGLPEAATRKFIDPNSEAYKLALEVATILLGQPVAHLATSNNRAAKRACVVVFNSRGQVLITRLSADTPDESSSWGFPGGDGNKGETFEQIARRQLEEKTGYKLLPEEEIYRAGNVEAIGNYGGEIGRQQVQDVFTLYLYPGEEALFSAKDETSEIAWAFPREIGLQGEATYGLGFFDIDFQLLVLAVQDAKNSEMDGDFEWKKDPPKLVGEKADY